MKVKRDYESLAVENSKGHPHRMPESRPDLRSAANKRMNRPSKLLAQACGFNKLQKFFAARGLYIGA